MNIPKLRLIRLCALAACCLAVVVAGAAEHQTFVRVSPRDPRYFELSDGRPYIPIGLNMIAPPGRDISGMDAWMSQLASNGGNFIRVWLSNPFFDVEHAKSGEYDAEKAKRIDDLLAIAVKHGICVKLCLEHFRHLGEGRQTWAGKPLHKIENGGTSRDIADFFNGQPSRDLFQRKLAWYAQRYGSHPQVFGWELWNEVNAVSGGDYMAWSEYMLPHLHTNFPGNLCMQSLGSFDTDRVRTNYQRLALMRGNDVAQVHRYLDLGARLEVCKGPMDVLAAEAVRELLAVKPGRPVLLAEGGAVEPQHTGPFKLYTADTNGMMLHDVLFAPFFAGAAGSGHIWHWDAYVSKNNLWWQFGRFAEAVKGVDPVGQNFTPVMLPHERLRVYCLKGESLTLLWCRDTQNTWQTELAEGKPPETLTGQVLALKTILPATPRVRFYDPWQNRWASGIPARDGTLALPQFQRSLVVRIGSEGRPK